MKRFLLVSIFVSALFMLGNNAQAQMPDGSIAPNFSLVDINGTTHVLYDYLDADKAAIIDFSAVWCSPCWNYHNTGALETAYTTWGPSGTNELQVFWIEGDEATLAQLQGASPSVGNWTTGVNFPQFLTIAPNGTSVVSNYEIGYFPTIYVVCPDRVIVEAGQVNATALKARCDACPAFPTTTNDAKMFSVKSPITSSCSADVTPQVVIQNYGSANLTSLVITSKVDGVAVGSPYTWNGNLGQFEVATVTLPQMTGIADGAHTFTAECSLPNTVADENTANDTKTSNFSVFSSGANVLVKVVTDNYPSEISWKIFLQGTSTVVAQKDDFTTGTNNTYVCLDYICYTFTIYDEYGDGILSPGYAQITFDGQTLVNILGTSYTTSKSVDFCVTHSSIGEEAAVSALSVYPNPFSTSTNIEVTLSESQDVMINVYNMIGEVVYQVPQGQLQAGSHTFQFDAGQLNSGIYIVRMNVGDKVISKTIELNR